MLFSHSKPDFCISNLTISNYVLPQHYHQRSVLPSPSKQIFVTGDLSRVHEIDKLIAAAYGKRKWSEVSLWFAHSFRHYCCAESDGAFLHAITQLPEFHVLVSPIITGIIPSFMNDDQIFLAKLCDALLPHVCPEHEDRLYRKFCNAIEIQCPVSVLEYWDTLWSKSISSDSDHVQMILDIYRGILNNQNVTSGLLIK